MLSCNEWDDLKIAIVSRANDSAIPFIDPSLRLVYYTNIANVKDIQTGPLPQQFIDETNEDLEKLAEFLHSVQCSVLRTDPVWKPKFTNLKPRDNLFLYDKLALAVPMPVQCRRDEWLAVSGLVEQYTPIIQAPVRNGTYDMYNAKVLEDHHTTALFNKIPLFDGSNILRANDDLYYIVSNSGNMQGAMYLQNLLPDKRVHIINNIKTNCHIHNTLVFLREGLMLVNPNHIQHKEQLPSTLHSWDMINCPNIDNSNNAVPMNLLVINPNLVVIEEHQVELKDELSKYNIDCVMLPMRHAKTLECGFRSVTLDVVRESHVNR